MSTVNGCELLTEENYLKPVIVVAPRKQDEVMGWLRALLSNGPVKVRDIKIFLLAKPDWTWQQLRAAKSEIGIESQKPTQGTNAPWEWWLPGTSRGKRPKTSIDKLRPDEKIIEDLLKIGKMRNSLPRDEFRWVVTQMPVAWRDVDEADIPSDYAVSWLVLAKANPSEFMRVIASKLIPPKLEGDSDRGFVDDGRVDELLDSQIRSLVG